MRTQDLRQIEIRRVKSREQAEELRQGDADAALLALHTQCGEAGIFEPFHGFKYQLALLFARDSALGNAFGDWCAMFVELGFSGTR